MSPVHTKGWRSESTSTNTLGKESGTPKEARKAACPQGFSSDISRGRKKADLEGQQGRFVFCGCGTADADTALLQSLVR